MWKLIKKANGGDSGFLAGLGSNDNLREAREAQPGEDQDP
jgi:hypothetical protein